MGGVGIVIVTYNSAAEIGPCLDAAISSGAEIVVVDNGSHDGAPAQVARRGIRLIANPDNRGFAAAVNQGFQALNCPYILLLNPDAVIQTSLDPLRAACELPHVAGAGGKLVDAAGDPQVGFMVRRFPTPASLILEALLLNRVWPNNPVNRRYRVLDLKIDSPAPVEQPAGAFLMLRRAVWQELGGFDEAFHPLWFEEVDFCRRAAGKGYLLYYVPSAVAKHTGGHSIPQLTVEMRRFYWYRSLLRFTSRHFHPIAFRAVCLAVVTGSILRGFLAKQSPQSGPAAHGSKREGRTACRPGAFLPARGTDGFCLALMVNYTDVDEKFRSFRFFYMAHTDSVSVTIVTYNSGRYIKRCIESVLAQRYQFKEIVIVDNASTDGNHHDILEQFEDRCQIIYNDDNIGFAAAQNQAIKFSSGDWVLTLNPDVLLLPNFIQALVDAGQFDPKIGTVCGKLLTMTAHFEIPEQPVVDSTGIYFNPMLRASGPRQPGSG